MGFAFGHALGRLAADPDLAEIDARAKELASAVRRPVALGRRAAQIRDGGGDPVARRDPKRLADDRTLVRVLAQLLALARASEAERDAPDPDASLQRALLRDRPGFGQTFQLVLGDRQHDVSRQLGLGALGALDDAADLLDPLDAERGLDERATEPAHLPDDDPIRLASLDAREQRLELRALLARAPGAVLLLDPRDDLDAVGAGPRFDRFALDVRAEVRRAAAPVLATDADV